MDSRLKFAFLASLVALIALAIATAPDYATVKMDKLNGHTLESDELYFKNIRRFYYEVEHKKEASMDVLRHKSRWKGVLEVHQGPFVSIVLNPKFDEAHALFEWNDGPLDGQLVLEMQDPKDTTRLELHFPDTDSQRAIAAQLYEALHRSEFGWLAHYQGQTVKVWTTNEERQTLKTVLKDYFRLVGAL